ncbi:MAG: ABC transporter ATP-binding protein [Candidatus Heimdallarchaeota archaeon]|nr:ABC transporter ATP-binding protein [Candidatus Heimdallarchaeota archaeon]
MKEVIAEVNHVTRTFGDVVAVSDASFSVEMGAITGFLGPNGAGKTTCIRMLLGLIKPHTGNVKLFTKDPFTNSSARSLIGYISEEGSFPKWMKARDYFISHARYHMTLEEAIKRAEEVLEEVGLTKVANKRIRQFSKGMRQRIKIGQALIHKPALVIADEPFNGLDPVVRHNMFELFEKYRKEYNTSFFISSHILFEMEKIAEKIILLYKGRTIAQGSPVRIREMIDDQPHSIQITLEQSKELANALIEQADNRVVSQINFGTDPRSGQNQLLVLTHEARAFYTLLTDIVVQKNLDVAEVKATDEGLQSLFTSLTVG